MNSTLCDNVQLSVAFSILCYALLALTFGSFVLNSFTYYLLSRSRSLHSNVRLLLKNFLLSATIFSIAGFGRTTYNFYVSKHGLFAMSPFSCQMTEIPWDVCAIGSTHSISFIGIERIITTIWKRKFIDPEHPSQLAYVMVVASWVAGLVSSALLSASTYFVEGPLCYCFVVTAIPPYAQYIIGPSYIAMEIVTISTFVFLYKYSRSTFLDFTINTTRHSLAERHQLLTNMETTLLLTPIMILHGVCYIIGVSAFIIGRTLVVDPATAATYYAALLTFFTAESAVHPIFLLTKHRKLREMACEICIRLMKGQREAKVRTAEAQERESRAIKQFEPVVALSRRLHGRNVISPAVVEYRMRPEDNEQILNSLWEKQPKCHK